MANCWSVLAMIACLSCPASADPADMVRLAGTPAEIGRTFGTLNKGWIAHDLDVDFLRKGAAKNISEQVLIDRAKAFVRIVEQIAPHWLEETRAIAQAAGVCPDLYLAFVATRERELFLHECTSYAVSRDCARDGAILFHKNRDNKERAQAAYIVESSLPGIHKFIAVGDANCIACSMMVNDRGLAGSADYPANLTRKDDPHALVPAPADPQYRGMMSGAMLRYIAERASTCAEALSIIRDFVNKGYYSGGKVNGQHWLFVDRAGTILEVSNNSRQVVSRVHTERVYFSRLDQSPAARMLREAGRPIDFHLFHNVARDPSICTKSSISGMTVEIDPVHPELFTCAWISLPARAVSFPLLMGQTATPACLANGQVHALGSRTGDERTLWQDAEQSAHASKANLVEKASADASGLLDSWSQQQAEALSDLLCANDPEAQSLSVASGRRHWDSGRRPRPLRTRRR